MRERVFCIYIGFSKIVILYARVYVREPESVRLAPNICENEVAFALRKSFTRLDVYNNTPRILYIRSENVTRNFKSRLLLKYALNVLSFLLIHFKKLHICT